MAKAESIAEAASAVAPQVRRGLLGVIGMSFAVALYFVMALPAAVLMHLVGHHIIRGWRHRGIAVTGALLAVLVIAFAVPAQIGLNLHDQRLAAERATQQERQIDALLHLAARLRAAQQAEQADVTPLDL